MNISPNVFPSPDGITRLLVNVPPVSSQSSSERKNVVKDAIKAITRPIEIILTVDIKKGLCLPINRSLKPDQLRRFLDTYEKQLQTRDELLSLVSDQSEARG